VRAAAFAVIIAWVIEPDSRYTNYPLVLVTSATATRWALARPSLILRSQLANPCTLCPGSP
ncbi:MAG: hypothetical protein WA891_15535, partial [Acidobacteriaceae bacterium]